MIQTVYLIKSLTMSSRITASSVKAIIDTSIEDISIYIDTATTVVADRLSGKGLSENTLSKIELYLAAHFVALKERQVKAETIGEASNTYEGAVGMHLNASRYGQTAIILDSSGTLASIGKPKEYVGFLSSGAFR
jgi:hypothetical protein